MSISRSQMVLLIAVAGWIAPVGAQEAKPFKTFTQLQKELEAVKSPPVTPAIAWETDVRSAYSKAVAKNYPLIILFLNAPGPEAGDLSDKALREIEADGLKEFQDRVVFAKVLLSKSLDPSDFGLEIAKTLKLKDVPYVAFLAPNPTKICQVYAMEGYFTVDQIKADLTKFIPGVMHPKFTWAPPSPAALLAQVEEACKEGNVLQYAACFCDPLRTTFADLYHAETAAHIAKQRAIEAIEMKFGPQTAQPNVLTNQRIADGLRGLRRFKLLESMATVGGANLRYSVEQLQRNGEITTGDKTVYCVEELHGWRMVPEGSEQTTANLKQTTKAYQLYADELNKIAALVLENQFKSAEEVRAAIEQIGEMQVSHESAVAKQPNTPPNK